MAALLKIKPSVRVNSQCHVPTFLLTAGVREPQVLPRTHALVCTAVAVHTATKQKQLVHPSAGRNVSKRLNVIEQYKAVMH